MTKSSVKSNLFMPWLSLPVIWLVLAYGVFVVFSGALPTTHFFDTPTGYLPIHTALEFFAIAVAVLIFAIVWHTRDKHQDGGSLFLASLFLGVAALDFLHTLSFMGMPVMVTPSSVEKSINFWLAARLMAVTGLLGTVLWTCDCIKNRSGRRFCCLE